MEEAKLDISSLDDELEKEILILLDRKNKCMHGSIVKELSLSVDKAQIAINSLISKGYIKQTDRSFLQLNVSLV